MQKAEQSLDTFQRETVELLQPKDYVIDVVVITEPSPDKDQKAA